MTNIFFVFSFTLNQNIIYKTMNRKRQNYTPKIAGSLTTVEDLEHIKNTELKKIKRFLKHHLKSSEKVKNDEALLLKNKYWKRQQSVFGKLSYENKRIRQFFTRHFLGIKENFGVQHENEMYWFDFHVSYRKINIFVISRYRTMGDDTQKENNNILDAVYGEKTLFYFIPEKNYTYDELKTLAEQMKLKADMLVKNKFDNTKK